MTCLMVQDLATQQLVEINIPFLLVPSFVSLGSDSGYSTSTTGGISDRPRGFSPFRLCPRYIEIAFLVTLIPDIPFPLNRILFLLLLLIQGNSYLLVEKLSYPSYYYPFDLSFRRPFLFHTFLWFHPVKERRILSFLLPRRTSLLLHPLQSQLTQQPYRRATLSPNPNFEEKSPSCISREIQFHSATPILSFLLIPILCPILLIYFISMEPSSSELATDLAAYLAADSTAVDYPVSAYSISVELVNAAPLLLSISLVFNSDASFPIAAFPASTTHPSCR